MSHLLSRLSVYEYYAFEDRLWEFGFICYSREDTESMAKSFDGHLFWIRCDIEDESRFYQFELFFIRGIRAWLYDRKYERKNP